MRKITQLVLCIAATLSIGAIGGVATASGVTGWYQTLNKPGLIRRMNFLVRYGPRCIC